MMRWLCSVMKLGIGTYFVDFCEGSLRAMRKGKNKADVKLKQITEDEERPALFEIKIIIAIFVKIKPIRI